MRRHLEHISKVLDELSSDGAADDARLRLHKIRIQGKTVRPARGLARSCQSY